MGFKNSLTLGNCVKTMHKVIREQIITINKLARQVFEIPISFWESYSEYDMGQSI